MTTTANDTSNTNKNFRLLAITSDTCRLVAVLGMLIFVVTDNTGLLKDIMLVTAVVLLWEQVFSAMRADAFDFTGAATTAILFVLLLPMSLQWWQLILFPTFGVVVGEQIFGGRRHAIVTALTAGLAFYFYSYQPVTDAPVTALNANWLLIPLALMLVWRAADWLAIGALLVTFLTAAHFFHTGIPDALPSSAIIVFLLFCAFNRDLLPEHPFTRSLYGVLLGVLLVILDTSLQSLSTVVSACLLAGVTVPLLNTMVTGWYDLRSAKQINKAAVK